MCPSKDRNLLARPSTIQDSSFVNCVTIGEGGPHVNAVGVGRSGAPTPEKSSRENTSQRVGLDVPVGPQINPWSLEPWWRLLR